MKKKTIREVVNVDAEIIDKETGEILTSSVGDKSRVIIETKVEEEPDEVVYSSNFNQGESFVKLYDEVVPALREHLTPSEFVFAISLSQFVSYNDCILRETNHGNSKIIDAKEISELLNMDYSTTRRLISSLIKKGVIGQHKTGDINKDLDTRMKKVYIVNPYIYFRGTTINDTVKSIYCDTEWARIINNNSKNKD